MIKSLDKTLTGKFHEVFTEIPCQHTIELKNGCELRLYQLVELDTNLFSFGKLEKFIRRNVGQYVFSRAKLEEYKTDDDVYSVGADALSIIKQNNPDNNFDSELGGMLIYIFLEEVLKAPKIMTKVEVQNNSATIKGKCDGIHLLSKGNDYGYPYYHMIFGASSIIGDLKDAIDSAFNILTNIDVKTSKDHILAEPALFEKRVNKSTAEEIQRQLIPDKNTKPQCDTAFGIFLGYDLGLDIEKYSSPEFRKVAERKVAFDLEKHLSYIVEKINSLSLQRNSFYFYILPFNNVRNDKAEIMQKVINGG